MIPFSLFLVRCLVWQKRWQKESPRGFKPSLTTWSKITGYLTFYICIQYFVIFLIILVNKYVFRSLRCPLDLFSRCFQHDLIFIVTFFGVLGDVVYEEVRRTELGGWRLKKGLHFEKGLECTIKYSCLYWIKHFI